jgi:uncharacterized repeat protein (TIGR01451 family)
LSGLLPLLALLPAGGCFGTAPPASLSSASPPAAAQAVARPGTRLEVKPARAVSPIRTEQVLIATVIDGNSPRRRQVEWKLEGAGTIVAVDEGGDLFARGHRVNGHSAVTYTGPARHVSRGTGSPADDFTVEAGQTWCVISSQVEGDTQVTVQAPGLTGPECKQLITQHWVDARWSLPPVQAVRAGTPVVLLTTLFRNSDVRQPLAGYRVRYRILEGPPALFTPGQSGEAVVATDSEGRAAVSLVQAHPGPGGNRVGVEIFRPDFSSGDLTAALLGQGDTTVEWQAPALALEGVLPPTAVLGQEVSCVLTVRNTGSLPARFVTVKAPLLEGMAYVRSNPPAIADKGQLVWTLDPLAGPGTRTLEVVYRPLRTGTCAGRARVTAAEEAPGRQPAGSLAVEGAFQTQVVPEPEPRLRVEVNGPGTGLVLHGNASATAAPLTYQLTVSNQGTDTIRNARVRMELDPALEPESGVNPVEWPVGDLAPGTRRTLAVRLRPERAGRAVNRITALADNKVVGQGEQVITIQEAGVNLTLTGPASRHVGKPIAWELEVANAGATPLAQVVVSDLLPPELQFDSASDGGRPQGQTVVWMVGDLKPKEVRKLQLKTTGSRAAPRVVCQAQVTAVAVTEAAPAANAPGPAGASPSPPVGGPGPRAQAEAAVALLGLPAFKLKVAGRGPIEVGERTSYTIDLINQGTLPGSGLRVVGTLPPQVQLVAAGPVPYQVEGQKVVFAPVDNLPVGYMVRYMVEVQGSKPGEARFRAELSSPLLQQPVARENSIAVHGVEPTAGTPDEPGASATGGAEPPAARPAPPVADAPGAPKTPVVQTPGSPTSPAPLPPPEGH